MSHDLIERSLCRVNSCVCNASHSLGFLLHDVCVKLKVIITNVLFACHAYQASFKYGIEFYLIYPFHVMDDGSSYGMMLFV